MKNKTQLFLIFSLTLISLGTWVIIMFNYNPNLADILIPSAFWSSLFLSLWGILTFILYFLRAQFTNREVIYSHLSISIRHSILITSCVVGLLFLKSMNVLTWWVATMFVMVVLLLELFFRTKKINYSANRLMN